MFGSFFTFGFGVVYYIMEYALDPVLKNRLWNSFCLSGGVTVGLIIIAIVVKPRYSED